MLNSLLYTTYIENRILQASRTSCFADILQICDYSSAHKNLLARTTLVSFQEFLVEDEDVALSITGKRKRIFMNLHELHNILEMLLPFFFFFFFSSPFCCFLVVLSGECWFYNLDPNTIPYILEFLYFINIFYLSFYSWRREDF